MEARSRQTKDKICCNTVIWNKEEQSHLSMQDIQSSITITWIDLTETNRAENLSISSRDQIDLAAGLRVDSCE